MPWQSVQFRPVTNGLRQRAVLAELPDRPCCYAIYEWGELVYIGKTVNLKSRISMHQRRLRVDWRTPGAVTIKYRLPKKYGEWAMAELRLLARLKPVLNGRRLR